MTSIVVLHYDRIPLTAECCKTLVSQKEPARVLVVDNGSPSHGGAELRAALPAEVEVLRLPKQSRSQTCDGSYSDSKKRSNCSAISAQE